MSEMTQHHPAAGGGPGDEHDHASDADLRCPSCGALRPPAVTWCTQCYARFDTPEPAPDAAPGLGPAEPSRPRAPDSRVAPDEVEARAEELLARLAGDGAAGGGVRSWSGRVQGNGQRVLVIVVGTLLLTGLLFGLMAVVGALL